MENTLAEILMAGVEAHRSGRLQEAQELYSAVIEVDANNPDANHNMGVLYMGLGKTPNALPFFKLALEANSDTLQYWISYIDALIRYGNSSDAQEILDLAVSKGLESEEFTQLERRIRQLTSESIEPHSDSQSKGSEPPLEQLQALINLYNQKDFQAALAKTLQLLQEFPTSVIVHNTQGASYAGLEMFTAAIRSYRKAIELQPENHEAHNNLGIALQSHGELDAAIECYQQAFTINPNYAEAYNNLGTSLRKKGELKAAVKNFKKAIEIKPEVAEFHNNIGGVLEEMGDLQAAMNSYRRIIEISPASAEPYFKIGNVHKKAGNSDAAVDSYKEALEINPFLAHAHNNLGTTLAENGDLQEAIDSYRQALKADPDYAEAHNNLGNALLSSGDLELAIVSLNKAIEIQPRYGQAYFNLGLVQRKGGSLKAAIGSFKRAVEFDPFNAEIHNYLGMALDEIGQLDAALDSYTSAIKINPEFAEAYNNMGVILDSKGDRSQAADKYRMAIDLIPEFVTAHFNQGANYQAVGKYEDSVVSFDNAIKCHTPGSYDLERIYAFLLRSLYLLGNMTRFHDTLGYVDRLGWGNAIIGSLASRASLKFETNLENPFCNDPISFVMEKSLSDSCDFEKVFVANVKAILDAETTTFKNQSLLQNSVQTAGNFFASESELSEELRNIIILEIEKYREHFHNSTEGIIRNWPADFELNGWIVSMSSGGAIRPHIHENGWISGSVYINVPKLGQTDSGSLVVAVEDNHDVEAGTKSCRKVIAVKTGSLCLFPASLYHHTIPFESDEPRIVLAFDVVPKR